MKTKAFNPTTAQVGDTIEGESKSVFTNTHFTIYSILREEQLNGYVLVFYLRPQYGKKHVYTVWARFGNDGSIKFSEITMKHRSGSVY